MQNPGLYVPVGVWEPSMGMLHRTKRMLSTKGKDFHRRPLMLAFKEQQSSHTLIPLTRSGGGDVDQENRFCQGDCLVKNRR